MINISYDILCSPCHVLSHVDQNWIWSLFTYALLTTQCVCWHISSELSCIQTLSKSRTKMFIFWTCTIPRKVNVNQMTYPHHHKIHKTNINLLIPTPTHFMNIKIRTAWVIPCLSSHDLPTAMQNSIYTYHYFTSVCSVKINHHCIHLNLGTYITNSTISCQKSNFSKFCTQIPFSTKKKPDEIF